MSDFEWDPDSFLTTMLEEIPGYEELQEAIAVVARGRNVLELGTGTGETAVRILARNPGARWTGIDASAPMLDRARERLPDADLRVGRLEDPLPKGLSTSSYPRLRSIISMGRRSATSFAASRKWVTSSYSATSSLPSEPRTP